MAEFNLEGLLGNAFGGGTGNFLDEYLTPEQRAMMQRNAMLAASAALLKAGGESTRRIGIGEALGGAFEAGQAGYEKAQTGALTQMALKQKLDEAKKAKELQKLIAGVFSPPAATPGAAPIDAMLQPAAPMTLPKVGDPYLRRSIIENPERREDQVPMGQMQQMYTTQADLDALQNYKGSTVQLPPDLTAPVNRVPTSQGMPTPMNQNVARANQYRKAAQMLNMAGQGEQAMKYEDLAYKLDPTPTLSDKSKLLAELGLAPTIANLRLLEKPEGLSDKAKLLAELGLAPTIANLRLLDKPDASPSEVRILEATGTPVTLANVIALRKSGAASQSVNVGGQIYEKAEQKGMGEFNIKNFGEASTAAGLAQKTLPSLEIQSQILNKGFTTGFGTEVQKAGASVLAALGVPEAAKFATDAQTFLAATQQAVLQKQLEQKGPQTEADSRRVTQTGAQLGNTVQANQFLIDVAREQLKRDIERKTFLESWFKTNETLRGADDAWFSGAGGQSLFDRPGLKKYAAPVQAPSVGGFKYIGKVSK